jgi:hypothetical protein
LSKVSAFLLRGEYAHQYGYSNRDPNANAYGHTDGNCDQDEYPNEHQNTNSNEHCYSNRDPDRYLNEH